MRRGSLWLSLVLVGCEFMDFTKLVEKTSLVVDRKFGLFGPFTQEARSNILVKR